jgi:serine protease Do
MKYFCTALVVSLTLLLPVSARAGDEVEKAAARVWPSLVRIRVVVTDSADGREVKQEASGSGAIIGKRGYVITNHHVAGHAVRAVCILPNNEEIEAELVGTDPMTDIAILKLRPHPEQGGDTREFPTVNFANSDELKIGDVVLAMGSPLALSQSVTRGIVSNTRLTMPSYMGTFDLDGEDVGALVRWIAHDAAIFPGNSGGPLVNLKGEIVGINEISIGLAGAIPGNLAKRVANELIEHGSVRRAWLGIEIQPLLKDHTDRGALVAGITEGSPAAKTSLQSGDILLQINHHAVTVRYREELPILNQLIVDLAIGKPVDLVYLRDGKEHRTTITPLQREPAQPRATELKAWGITVRNLTKLASLELKRDDANGVLVTTVRPGGPSGTARPGLQSLDVITAVDGKPIRNVADLSALTGRLLKGKTAPVPVMAAFDRKSEQLLTVIKLVMKEIEDPGNEVRKAWLPVSLQALTPEVAAQLGDANLTGVRVTQVYTNHSAALAGLRVGDIITALDGERVTAKQPGDEESFTAAIRQYHVGDKPDLSIQRGKEQLKLAVALERSPKLEREMKKYTDTLLEFTARDLTFSDLADEELPATQSGVIVTDLTRGGWASLAHLCSNDIILDVNNTPVTDVDSLEKVLSSIAKATPETIVLRVLRGIHTVFVEIEPNWKN